MNPETVESVFSEDMIHETEMKAITEDFSFIDIFDEMAPMPMKSLLDREEDF